MAIVLALADQALLASLHIAAEWAALIFALAIAAGVTLVSAVAYRV